MRFRDVFYTVFSLHDGTIIATLPTRKPSRVRGKRAPKIDDERICKWHFEKWEQLTEMPDRMWTAFQVVTSTRLNMLRIVRQQLKPDLAKIIDSLDALHQRIDELEKKIGSN